MPFFFTLVWIHSPVRWNDSTCLFSSRSFISGRVSPARTFHLRVHHFQSAHLAAVQGLVIAGLLPNETRLRLSFASAVPKMPGIRLIRQFGGCFFNFFSFCSLHYNNENLSTLYRDSIASLPSFSSLFCKRKKKMFTFYWCMMMKWKCVSDEIFFRYDV